MPRAVRVVALGVSALLIMEASARGQAAASACSPIVLSGPVRECTATGSPLLQLRAATLIAGSEATGDTLARAVALEVATAPAASSSAGLTFTFDPATRTFRRRAGTYGPAFSERAVTIGKGKLSGGLSFIHRSYDRLEDLSLEGFEVFRFHEGVLAVSASRFELEAQTETLAAFAHYGLLDRLDLGVVVPYVRVSINGTSRIFGQHDDELQRVFLNATENGIGDIAILAKYGLWQSPSASAGRENRQAGLAAMMAVRLPSGDEDRLLGLGLTRTSLSLIGSGTFGRLSSHLNAGYELWSGGVDIPTDFQGLSTIEAKDQILYSVGIEYEVHPQLSGMVDVLGRYVRGGGRVGYQPYTFPENFARVAGADALSAVPDGVHNVLIVPGAKWNAFKSMLVTVNVLVPVTSRGLRSRVSPVIGGEWAF